MQLITYTSYSSARRYKIKVKIRHLFYNFIPYTPINNGG